MSKHMPMQYHWEVFYGGYVLLNQHDEEVLVGYQRSRSAPPTIASDRKDRNFIVRALNAHDDLVAACNAAAALCENIRLGVRNYEAATPFVRQRLDAALAKGKP